MLAMHVSRAATGSVNVGVPAFPSTNNILFMRVDERANDE